MGTPNSKRAATVSETPLLEAEPVTRLLLVGKVGVGKSSTANTIVQLPTRPFKTDLSTTSVTSKIQIEFADFQGRSLKIVDLPGLDDADMSEGEDIKRFEREAMTAVAETPSGYDAVLIVIEIGRLTKEDKKIIDKLKRILGDNFVKENGILVVTHGDRFKPEKNKGQTFQQWCSAQKGDFNSLWKESGKRAVLFNNATDIEEEMEGQVKQLLEIVDTMKGGSKYTSHLFQAANKRREHLIKNAEESDLREMLTRDTRLVMNDLFAIEINDACIDLVKLQEIKAKLEKVLLTGKENGKGVKAVKEVMDLAQSVYEAIDKKIVTTGDVIKIKRENEENKQNPQWEKRKTKNEKKIEKLKEKMKTMDKNLDEKYQTLTRNNDVRNKILIEVLIMAASIGIGALTGGVGGVIGGVAGRALFGKVAGEALTAAVYVAAPKVISTLTSASKDS